MSVTRAALAVALAVGVGPVWADNAKPRGGGSGGGSSSGGSHHSGGGSSSASSHGSSGSYSSSSGSSAHGSARSQSDAERRHPRAGTGRYYRYNGHGYRYGYRGSYYYPSYYPSYWSFYYGYPYYPYYGSYYGLNDYPYYGNYGTYGYRHRSTYGGAGSVRLMVDPNKTRVYVDGYYAGVVDDYDGLFQRLHVAPGRHEIALKLDGYRTHRMKVYVPYDDTLKIHYDMVRGDGEDMEDMAGPADRDQFDRRAARDDDDDDYNGPAADRAPDRERAAPVSHNGELRLNVRPDDASIYVDGAFRGTARQLRMLRVEAGHHRIEVVRPGFRTWERDVEVKAGDSASVDVELER